MWPAGFIQNLPHASGRAVGWLRAGMALALLPPRLSDLDHSDARRARAPFLLGGQNIQAEEDRTKRQRTLRASGGAGLPAAGSAVSGLHVREQ